MQRGISGGQKKRVTTGEMLVSPMKTLFMDDISTGLDSSTTFQVVKCLQQFVHIMKGTILMSLLQPAPETFELFDDIILLSEGQIVYQGPRQHVLEFFEGCGFRCPERKSIADFLQEVTSRKDQEQYWTADREQYQYVTVKQFTEKFNQFYMGKNLVEELSIPYDKTSCHKAALSFNKYSISKFELLKVCFDREWLLMKRNSFLYVFMFVQMVVVACITMSVFIRTRMKIDVLHGNYYLGALFFSLIIIMFNGYAEIAMTMARLPVFFKQRDLLFYPAWTYTIPTCLLKIPLAVFESFVWTALSYYVIGFAPEASRFFRQFLVLFCLHQVSSSLFRLIAGICRTMVISNTGGSFCLLIIFILSGFIIPTTSIPKWWIWGYWVSPLAYAETAISVNEFLAPRWQKPYSSNTSIGLHVLESRGLLKEAHFYWISVGALVGFTVLFNILLTVALTYLNPIEKAHVVITEEKLAEIQKTEGDAFTDQNMQLSCTEVEVQIDNLSSESRRHNVVHDIPTKQAKQGMILPFHPLTISFRDVQYFVDMTSEMKALGATEKRLQLLKDITGAFRPGVLTALMGISGAGKTTLMDVLSGRKTGGYIEGDICISGFPKVQETFARVSGYCEQTDIHSPQITVRESVLFSAYMRLSPEIDDKSKQMFVDEVMELVELDNLKDTMVGLPGVSGLSTEQRKRLTIAVELVANPSIIFMDEPTSGLDARAAAIVMRAVRNTVDTGRTVVCTIHQPSIDIFEAFDELLLMKQRGQIIYAGPLGRHSINVIEYFQAIHGVARIKDKCNPATWMLEISSASAEQRLGIDFAEIYMKSSLHEHNLELVKQLSMPVQGARDLHFPTQFSQPPWAQFIACLWKQHWTYWRSPDYNLVRLFFTFISALFFGTIYWQLGTKIHAQDDLFTVMGALYGSTLFLGITNSSVVQPIVAVERTVFYREKAAGMYSPLPYALSQIVIEIPYIFLQTVMYGLITYFMIGFQLSVVKFFWYIFTMFFTFLYFTFYGMLAVSITPNFQVAAVVASAFYNLFNLFSGFLIPRPDLPKWWQWYYWICPTSWTLTALTTSQYGDLDKNITVDGIEKPIRTFLEDYFGYDHDFLSVVGTVLVIFPVFFAILFAYSITTLNFQRR
ncbi:ABC transporter G family member 36 isoform X2 [Cryptomeria japonica]|nr:ABC transporter G family member 36 isoform X2 [Cryptomeria japonica]